MLSHHWAERNVVDFLSSDDREAMRSTSRTMASQYQRCDLSRCLAGDPDCANWCDSLSSLHKFVGVLLAIHQFLGKQRVISTAAGRFRIRDYVDVNVRAGPLEVTLTRFNGDIAFYINASAHGERVTGDAPHSASEVDAYFETILRKFRRVGVMDLDVDDITIGISMTCRRWQGLEDPCPFFENPDGVELQMLFGAPLLDAMLFGQTATSVNNPKLTWVYDVNISDAFAKLNAVFVIADEVARRGWPDFFASEVFRAEEVERRQMMLADFEAERMRQDEEWEVRRAQMEEQRAQWREQMEMGRADEQGRQNRVREQWRLLEDRQVGELRRHYPVFTQSVHSDFPDMLRSEEVERWGSGLSAAARNVFSNFGPAFVFFALLSTAGAVFSESQ